MLSVRVVRTPYSGFGYEYLRGWVVNGRTRRVGLVAAAVALPLVAALGGCTSEGSGGASATQAASSPAATPPVTPAPGQSPDQSPGQSPGQSATPGSSSPSVTPAPGETLVIVTRSGGLQGKQRSLIIKNDGSLLRLDAKAVTVAGDRLSAADLAKLRTALQEADFPHLPRTSMSDHPVIDGFTYAFVHGGYEVAADQPSLPKPLQKVLDALPPFDPR